MASTSSITYCTDRDIQDVFPGISGFDLKRRIYNWESLGNNVYASHNTGLVTQLYVDGKESSTPNRLQAFGTTYKTRITSTLEDSAENQATFNLVNYNASFITGAEADMQVGDYVGMLDGGSTEYLYIESINLGANQINVRRGALGTTIDRHPTGGLVDPGFQDALRVDELNHWFYDEYYDQVLMYSTSSPNDMIIEAGDDWGTIKTRFRKQASRLLESRIDANLSREVSKDREGNYPDIIVRATALQAVILLISAHDPNNEVVGSFKDEYNEILEGLNAGTIVLPSDRTSDSKNGVIREVSVNASSTVRPVELKGQYIGSGYDLLKVKVYVAGSGAGTSAAIGTVKYSVWNKNSSGLKNNQVVENEVITGDYDVLSGGLYIRWSGVTDASVAYEEDEYEIEIFSSSLGTSTPSGIKTIAMSRR